MSRPIDLFEDEIVQVMDMVDNGVAPSDAYAHTAEQAGLTEQRLRHLVAVWCAIGGFEVPS